MEGGRIYLWAVIPALGSPGENGRHRVRFRSNSLTAALAAARRLSKPADAAEIRHGRADTVYRVVSWGTNATYITINDAERTATVDESTFARVVPEFFRGPS